MAHISFFRSAPLLLLVALFVAGSRSAAAQQVQVPSSADCAARVQAIGENNLLLRWVCELWSADQGNARL